MRKEIFVERCFLQQIAGNLHRFLSVDISVRTDTPRKTVRRQGIEASMKEVWKSAPLWIKAMALLILILVVFSALGPSPRDRALARYSRAPASTFNTLMATGAILTHKTTLTEAPGQVVLVWDANSKGKVSSYFLESQFHQFDVWELPINAEKHLPAIDSIHQMTFNPVRKNDSSGITRQIGNPFGYTIPKAKLPNAAQRKIAKDRARKLTEAFRRTGLFLPSGVTAYVKIPKEDRIFVITDGNDMYSLRQLFELP